MARIWAADGRDLVLCARRTAELDALQETLLSSYPDRRILVEELDVNDRDAIRRAFARTVDELGGLDRVVVNAGVDFGRPIGTDSGDGNHVTAQTNFVGALNQIEASLAHFRGVKAGHLVLISSMAALRGLRGDIAVYGATKAALASLGEGLRSEFWDSPIEVTTVFPGYIQTAMTDGGPPRRWLAPLAPATAELVRAVDAERAKAYIPAWPWTALSVAMRLAPLGAFRRMGG